MDLHNWEEFKEYNANATCAGEISDGDHSFNDLYYHRMLLFSIICNENRDLAWKSWKHHDDTMYDGYFIVGIGNNEGYFSYHYKEEYWSLFDVMEIENAPEWDEDTDVGIEELSELIANLRYESFNIEYAEL